MDEMEVEELKKMAEELELAEDMEEDLEFEQALSRIEEIVDDLEAGELSLDKSLARFIEGVRLIKFCNQQLKKAEKKVEVVLKEEEEFKEIVPFSEEEEETE